MWTFIKVILVIVAMFYQFVIVLGAENIGEETGNYSLATYEMLWLILLFFIGKDIMEDD